MKILEFGNPRNEKMILIHGFESPYQVWEDYIKYFEKDYFIIVPILTGHNPEIKEDFVSFESEVKELEQYYTNKFGNDVYVIYGMSMGGIVASMIWKNKNINIRKLILESSPLVSQSNFITSILTKQYLTITEKARQRDENVVAQAVGSMVKEKHLEIFLKLLDNMSDTTIVNYLKAVGSFKLPPNIDTPSTEIYYLHGTKMVDMTRDLCHPRRSQSATKVGMPVPPKSFFECHHQIEKPSRFMFFVTVIFIFLMNPHSRQFCMLSEVFYLEWNRPRYFHQVTYAILLVLAGN